MGLNQQPSPERPPKEGTRGVVTDVVVPIVAPSVAAVAGVAAAHVLSGRKPKK